MNELMRSDVGESEAPFTKLQASEIKAVSQRWAISVTAESGS